MIDHDAKRIFIDFSTLNAFRKCKEFARISYKEGWQPRSRRVALDFGSCIHAGIAAMYDAKAGGQWQGKKWVPEEIKPWDAAKRAFIAKLRELGAALPVVIESEERRSIERGIALLDAYAARWKNEPFENILSPKGSPLVEVGFRYPIGTIRIGESEYVIYYVGYIDRIMRNIATSRPVVWEFKTTTESPKYYIQAAKPNHQVTGYFPAARNMA